MNKKLRCLYIEPNKSPRLVEIEDTLEAKQKLVGGLIECVYIPEYNNFVLICNEEGKINGLPFNRDIGFDVIAGPFFIVGDDYKNAGFRSLSRKEISQLNYMFSEYKMKEVHTRDYYIKQSQKDDR